MIIINRNDIEILTNSLTENEQKSLLNKDFVPCSQTVADHKPWIKETRNNIGTVTGYKVIVPILTETIKNKYYHIFASNETSGAIIEYFYQSGYYQKISDTQLKGIIKKHIPLELQKVKDIEDCLRLWEMDAKYTSFNELNFDENIINFTNGILNLKTKQLLPHSPDYLCTIQIPCDYVSDVKTNNSLFDKYIYTLTNGNKEIENLILQFLGLSISNIYGYRIKKAMFLYGNGDTGKSKIRELAALLLGNENDSSADLAELEEHFGKSDIYGKRLVGSADISFATIRELKTFKRLTGGDYVNVEFKHKSAFTYKFNGLLWFCCNKLPHFGGDDGDWVFNRILAIHCPNVIPEHEQDKMLVEKMFKEKDYIISKAVNALYKVIENEYNLSVPKCCIIANEDYQRENNSVLKFIKDCCVERPQCKKDSCTSKRLYDIYKEFCKDENNGFAKTKSEFRRLILSKGYSETKSNGDNYFSITLSLAAKKDYAVIYGYDTV